MTMSRILMFIIAAGSILGGVDKILGNRFGLGKKFDDGFLLMGPMALSMAGIICLAPVISVWLGSVIRPIFSAIGIDPAMFDCVLAIDMGGYQLAMDLAQDPEIGRFSGMLQGQALGTIIYQCIPIFLLSAALLLGLSRFPDRTIHLFSGFARLIQIAATIGLILAAVQYISGVTFLPNLESLNNALEIVGSIAIVMLGSLPLAELLRRCLSRPFRWIGSKTGLNDASTTGIIVGTITVMPALAMVRDMDARGKALCGSFLVCGASAFAAHMGFAAATQPDLIMPLLGGKFAGALLGLVIALRMTRADAKRPSET